MLFPTNTLFYTNELGYRQFNYPVLDGVVQIQEPMEIEAMFLPNILYLEDRSIRAYKTPELIFWAKIPETIE